MKSIKKFINLTFNKTAYLEKEETEKVLLTQNKKNEKENIQIRSTFYSLVDEATSIDHISALTNLFKNGLTISDHDLLRVCKKIAQVIAPALRLNLSEKNKKDISALLSQLLITSHQIKKENNTEHNYYGDENARWIYRLISHERTKVNFNSLPTHKQITELSDYKNCLEFLKKIKNLVEPLYLGSEDFITQANLSVNMSLEELNNILKTKNFASNNMQEIAYIVSKSHPLSTPLGQKCFELQEKIFNLQKNYGEAINPEDKSLLKKIVEQDIPKLLPGASLTIPEISQKYEELSGKSLSSSMEGIVDKYIVLIKSMEEKYLSNTVESTDKTLKAQELYLDTKIDALRQTDAPKTMKMNG